MHHAGVAVHPHYSVVGCGSSPCFQPVLTVVVVLKQPSLIIHTSKDLLKQQSVLVDYCCFHLASSGASTAEGRRIKNPVWPSSCVTPAGTSNELDVQNGWEENTHTQVQH